MADNDTIITALQTLFAPGDVFEIRILDAVLPGSSWQHTQSGYFDYEHIELIPNLLANFKGYGGVYATLNPVNPDLLARANNRFKKAKSRETTGDKDILRRRWMLIDVDPVRPAGISATEAERNLSFEKAMEISEGLSSMGFASPMCVNSGNGTQLLYRVDLSAEDDGLVQRCLQALSPCSSEEVQVDLSVHNAARICRLPGTWNRKGDSTKERPHRVAEILELPDKKQLAGSTPQKQQTSSTNGYWGGDCPPAMDDYNSRADIAQLLEKHGWTLKDDENNNNRQQYWYRPGKTKGQHSATFDGKVFYVFSSNAQPFKDFTGYSKFGVYKWLEHNGDKAAAIEALEAEGYGDLERGVDISAFVEKFKEKATECKDAQADTVDIAPAAAKENKSKEVPIIPERMFNVPGFMNELMDFCMETAPYPNLRLAFCGSLTKQSFLAGRKVKAPGNIRGNIYLLGLASSGTGKDWPRKINSNIMLKIGAIDCLGSKFASGEGLEDVMAINYNMLYQTDEIDSMLRSMRSPKDSRYEGVGATLMILYTSADSSMPLRTKAGMDKCRSIINPHLTIFGTATPKNYYQALSERMMTNGFFSRMMVIDAGNRPLCEIAGDIDQLPERIIETAQFWHEKTRTMRNCGGNLSWENPKPQLVDYTGKAGELLFDFQRHSDVEHINADANDEVTKAIWSRAAENARKLALLRGCSENHKEPVISEQTAKWAIEFVDYQIKRQLYMAETYATDNDFHGQCLKFMEKLRNAPGQEMQHSRLLKLMKMDKDSFKRIVDTLIEQKDIRRNDLEQITKKGVKYVLCQR